MKKKIVIVMPTYNEAKNISRMIDKLVKDEFKKIKSADMQLLVVDGNSPDGTGDVVLKASKKYKNIHLLTEKEKRGLGMAYLAGFKYAIKKLNADAVIEMDADFQHPPKFVKPMVEAYLQGAEYVIGSRYIKGGSVPDDWEFSRKAISFLGNLFIRLTLLERNIHDLTTGFRLTDVKNVLKRIDLDNLMELERFAYKVDLLYQSVSISKKTVEVPLEFASRKEESSKYSSKEMFATFKVAIILGIRDKIRFFKYAVVGLLGYTINAVGIEIFRSFSITENLAEYFLYLKDVPALNIFTEASSWAAALAAEVSIISNFILNNSWTFSDKKISNPLEVVWKFLQFNFTSLGAIVIQFIVVGAAAAIFSDTSLVRQIALIFAVAFLIVPYNYIIYNLFIWKTWKLPGRKKK